MSLTSRPIIIYIFNNHILNVCQWNDSVCQSSSWPTHVNNGSCLMWILHHFCIIPLHSAEAAGKQFVRVPVTAWVFLLSFPLHESSARSKAGRLRQWDDVCWFISLDNPDSRLVTDTSWHIFYSGLYSHHTLLLSQAIIKLVSWHVQLSWWF